MINYNLISQAQIYYNSHNFKNVETPWRVTEEIINITKPEDSKTFQVLPDKCLVASGEQSFLYQYSKGFLPKGKFQTTTPCFRPDNHDIFHQKQFLKTELIDTENPTEENLIYILKIAQNFFNQFLETSIVKTPIGFDINYKNIELGSYGIRTYQNLKWIYATGIAEPRLSNTIEGIKNAIS